MIKYGFIGLGSMASAILRGMTRSGSFAEEEIYGSDLDTAKIKEMQTECGIYPAADAATCAAICDVVILAVKPQSLGTLLPMLAPFLTQEKTVISIAAGKDIAFYESAMPEGVPFVRVMPNLNAKVGASATAICGGGSARAAHLDIAERIFATVGSVYRLSEKDFPAFGAISGSSVAFAYMYIDALASAGVKAGLSKPLALDIAASTVLGSAKLINESGAHPAELIDLVCSPAGTTIEGIHTLRRLGFENTVYEGIAAILEKDERIRRG